MLFIILLSLNSIGVFCDDTGMFIIEKPLEPVRLNDNFQVFWNIPSMQCRSKGLPFPDLKAKYGIQQNTGDKFQGEHITILYDPGIFPALLQNGSSTYRRNGGVPQEGNLELHLETFAKNIHTIPRNFSGIGIIDFESWRPIFRQNFGSLQAYKELSYEIEAKRHPIWWKKSWIQEEAVRRFEEAGRKIMTSTLALARELRPLAHWGYYAYPYCFNMNPTTRKIQCPTNVMEENDRLSWLWSESTALFPSIYSKQDLPADSLQEMVRARVQEAKRVRNNCLILPYFWYRYRDGGFLTARDFKGTLSTLYKSSADGVILWGSSNDVNTKAKCQELLDYVEKILGPAVAKYTMHARRYRKLEGSDSLEVIDVEDIERDDVLHDPDDNLDDKEIVDLVKNADENKVKLSNKTIINVENEEINKNDNELDKINYKENKTILDKEKETEIDHEMNKQTENERSGSTDAKRTLFNDTVPIESVENATQIVPVTLEREENDYELRNNSSQIGSSGHSTRRDLDIVLIITVGLHGVIRQCM